VTAVPDLGYLHTGIEKVAKTRPTPKAITLTDRMDYLNPLGNNLVYCLAWKSCWAGNTKAGAVYPRDDGGTAADFLRIWCGLGRMPLDMGAMSVMLYCFREREEVLKIFEALRGPTHDDQLHPHRRAGAGTSRGWRDHGETIPGHDAGAESTNTKNCSPTTEFGREIERRGAPARGNTDRDEHGPAGFACGRCAL